MTASEIRDYLAEYVGAGKGDAEVMVCDARDNPVTDALCIKGALFIEASNGKCQIVLQTG